MVRGSSELTWGRRERGWSEGLFRFAIEQLQLVESRVCCGFLPRVPTPPCVTFRYFPRRFFLPASVSFFLVLPPIMAASLRSIAVCLPFFCCQAGDSFHIVSRVLHLYAQVLLRPGFLRQLQNSRR